VLDSLRQLAVSAVAHLRTRIALFMLELEREKLRLGVLVASVAVGLLFCVLAVVMGSFGIVAYYWDTAYRMQAVWLLAALFFAVAIGCAIVFRIKLRTRSVLFESSLAELHKDQQVLEQAK